MSAAEYNYERFDEFVASGGDEAMFTAFRDLNHAGSTAPDGELTKLSDRTPVRLSDLWRGRPVVLEFGSFT